MTIIYRNQIRARNKIAFFGGMPDDDKLLEFEDRNFFVEPCAEQGLQELAQIAAVVVTQDAKKPLKAANFLQNYANQLLNNGCQIFIRIADNGRAIIFNTVKSLKLPTAGLLPNEEEEIREWQTPSGQEFPPYPYMRILSQLEWKEVAKELAIIPPDRDPNDNLIIKIEDKQQVLTNSEEVLLKRAFYDCKEVNLLPMLDGLSGVLVYRAYATLPMGSHLQYFVKLGDRNEIFTEYFNYSEHVRDFIPFHLGPHLASDRCCLGSNKGIIVGDFVNESESLHDCARNGRAAHAIASLFNQTLNGWYIRARKDSRSIGVLLTHLFPTKDMPPTRLALAKKLGATRDLFDLLTVIKGIESAEVLIGPTHGDLHAKNVLVRTTEAIVIDFLKYSDDNPLVYDAASLEVGLLIDGFAEDDRHIETLIKSIEALYNCVNLHIAPICDHPKSKSFWFYNAIRQIRIHARQMECEENQYAAALVVALLRRASKDHMFKEDEEERRAAAYYLAEQILMNTFVMKP